MSDHQPSIIYVNKEQSPKDSSGDLTQAGIDRAFSTKQRTSGFSGASRPHNDHPSQRQTQGPNGEQLDVTDLERTLIDIVVRRAYAGGVRQVLTAFVRSGPRVSVERIAKLLRRLDYIYPYHQGIGFYLENAGHASAGDR
jgi:hypothetical protein